MSRQKIVAGNWKMNKSLQEAKTRHDKAHAIVNQAKFAAAMSYCKQQGFVFRVISEDSIFMNTTSRKGKR
jgi:triosephosphate isomerase